MLGIIAVNKRECRLTKAQVKMLTSSFPALTLLVLGGLVVLRRAPIYARFVRHDVIHKVDAVMSYDDEVYVTVGTRCHRCLRVVKHACWRALYIEQIH